jgi:acyl-CoA reductase-like NAD-dependent aldehyde dehydrogenase
VVNTKSLENLEGIIRRSVKEGAELLTGGERIKGKRAYFTGQLFLPMLYLPWK